MTQTKNAKQYADRLMTMVNSTLPVLNRYTEQQWKSKKEGKWSRLEILGHLIDSANNNHQRFIRTRDEAVPVIFYRQEVWNQYGAYNDCNPELIVGLWYNYNVFLANVIEHIEVKDFLKLTSDGKNEHTLEFIVKDYIDHLEHHLEQIVKGEFNQN
ncbi:MAG TPA: DinB family protein [Bacteroidia bacterium]